ncbi:MAG: divalent-cation tolerance protein CutA [Candidatus Altiarchaeota archaeon]|nr:divalent-cation tolerance protein CutA [Candidatus Altiarchaeota archaeon]
MVEFCKMLISAVNKEEARAMVKLLIEKHLVAGTFIAEGESHYWWKGEVLSRQDCHISAFSRRDFQDKILEVIKPIHSDECPIVAVEPIEGNACFMAWLKRNL